MIRIATARVPTDVVYNQSVWNMAFEEKVGGDMATDVVFAPPRDFPIISFLCVSCPVPASRRFVQEQEFNKPINQFSSRSSGGHKRISPPPEREIGTVLPHSENGLQSSILDCSSWPFQSRGEHGLNWGVCQWTEITAPVGVRLVNVGARCWSAGRPPVSTVLV